MSILTKEELKELMNKSIEKIHQETGKDKLQIQRELLAEMKEKLKPKLEQKPDWITDEQWKANPNVYHWEQSRKAMQLREKSMRTVTHEQAVQQARKLRASLGQNPQVYENLLNEQK